MAQQTTIAGLVGTGPAATTTKSTDLAPSTGGTLYVVDHYDSGRYLLKIVVSLGGANAAEVSTATYSSY